MDAFIDHVAFNDAPHITDARGGFTITTQTGLNTRIF